MEVFFFFFLRDHARAFLRDGQSFLGVFLRDDPCYFFFF